MQKQEAYKTTKDQQRFWKRILIVDDEADVTITFKAGIEDSNKMMLLTKELKYIHLMMPLQHCQNSNQISMIFFWLTLTCHI
jgi:hypothetical protein